MNRSYYITTPIYYVNGAPHIGHLYTTVAADVMKRYKAMSGYDTFFLTGTDEHGQKIEQAANKLGMTPKELADSVVKRYYEVWDRYDVKYDKFIRTTDSEHIATVQYIFEKLLEQGDLYEGEYEGWYCTPCEAFWPENQLAEGHSCPDCYRPVSKMKEPTYFFRMSKYGDRLLKHIENNPDFIKPESRKNEIVSFIKEGLRDLSVSRVTFNWGIPVKSNPKHIVYVWIDALVNYISALGYPDMKSKEFSRFWPADVHLVGKDILRFHAVYWPTILMALDLPLFKTVFAHGWWVVEGDKMSKSKNNMIEPLALVDLFGSDQIRFFLLREVTFGLDADFSYKAFIHRVNGDLANDFGNLVTRTLTMLHKYRDGIIPKCGEIGEDEEQLFSIMNHTALSYEKYMDELSFNKALISVWELVGALNRYIDVVQPWALFKDEQYRNKLDTVLYVLCDALHLLSLYIAPFMPNSASKLRSQLGIEKDIKDNAFKDELTIGWIKNGIKIGDVEALFPRLDEKSIIEGLSTGTKQDDSAKGVEIKEQESSKKISITDFEGIEIIAVHIKDAINVAKSEKLIKVTVDDGSGADRIIVAGIAKSYSPKDLIGKNVSILGNLKPAKLMGIESNGMILAAFDGERHHVLFLPDTVKPGTRVK